MTFPVLFLDSGNNLRHGRELPVPTRFGIRIALSLAQREGSFMNFSLKEIAFLAGGCLILLDRGASWMFILGISLLSIGATRIARNI